MSDTLFEESGFVARINGGRPLVDNSRFVFFIGLALDLMLFSGLIGAFYVLREGAASWPPPDLVILDLRVAESGSSCLLIASLLLVLTVRAQNRNSLGLMRASLAAALLFLLATLAIGVVQWRFYLASGVPMRSAFGILFLIVTAVYYVHIAASASYIAVKYRGMLRWKQYTRSGVSLMHLASFVVAMFVVWLGLVAVVYF
ncbi:MAG: hypothetical protein Q8922_06865 [Bacteroidota bacterium]|nr:hypothetical protein [Bacteroidota bacterium]MDP4232684.1 hypothetical protein [Bacteroidota bacterium]MDP4243183.1 hypothetical protein [Bacteroidota bacterium]MDP4287640.1 hypothetical protein [Bacteroidota bacterium]